MTAKYSMMFHNYVCRSACTCTGNQTKVDLHIIPIQKHLFDSVALDTGSEEIIHEGRIYKA